MAHTVQDSRSSKRKYTQQQVLEISSKACADPRTVAKFVGGSPVRGAVGERIAGAIKAIYGRRGK